MIVMNRKLKLKAHIEPDSIIKRWRPRNQGSTESLDLSLIDPEDYWMYKGWRVFCCAICSKEECEGCDPLPLPSEPNFDKYEERMQEVSDLMKEVEKINKEERDEENYKKIAPANFDAKFDYSIYTYEELKRMFPEIRDENGKFAKTKKEFMEKLRLRYVYNK